MKTFLPRTTLINTESGLDDKQRIMRKQVLFPGDIIEPDNYCSTLKIQLKTSLFCLNKQRI
jgi:hypothetical protein